MQYSHGDEHALRLANAQLSRLAIEELLVDIKVQAAQDFQKLWNAVFAVARPMRAPGLIHLRTDFQRGIE